MCNKNKNRYEKPKGKMTIEPHPPEGPWEQITADFLEMPPTGPTIWKGKVDELLVVVDTFSKQTILIPTRKTATTEEIFHLLWKESICDFWSSKENVVGQRSHIQNRKVEETNGRNGNGASFGNSISLADGRANRTKDTRTASIFPALSGLPATELD
jgi:hypothetical protein